MLLCESLRGSVKATQIASLGSISSTKRLSWLDRLILTEDAGGGIFTSPSTGWTSLLNGFRIEPFAAHSNRRIFPGLESLLEA